jgi:hypothetical protein
MEPEQSCPHRMKVKDGRDFDKNASSWSISFLVMLLAGLLPLPLILITVWLKRQSKAPSYSLIKSIEKGQDLLTPEVSSAALVPQVDNHDQGSRITLIIGCLGCALYIFGLVSSFVVLNEMLGVPLVTSLIAITASLPSAALLAHNMMSHVKKDQSPIARTLSHKQDISLQCIPHLRTLLIFTISSIAIMAVALKITLLVGCEAATSYAMGDAEVVEDESSQTHLIKHRTLVNVVSFTVLMVGGVECGVISARAHVELILIGAAIQLAVEIWPWGQAAITG